MSAFRRALILVLGLTVLAVCESTGAAAEPPQSKCLKPVKLQWLTKAIFQATERRMDANADANPQVDWKAVKEELQSLRADNLFTYSPVTFEGLNKETKAVRCAASVHITLPDKYKSESFVRLAHGVHTLDAPADLFNGRPEVQISYSLQPTAGGDDEALAVHDIGPLDDTLIVLAAARWMSSQDASGTH
jgi:hypothetical protein